MTHDTDPDELVPMHVSDPFEDETLREKLDDVNDAQPWIRWSALVVGIAIIVGGTIQWCNG